MAVDSALKRASATHVLLPFRNWVFPGTSGVSDAERLAAGWMYAGIAVVSVSYRRRGMLLRVYKGPD